MTDNPKDTLAPPNSGEGPVVEPTTKSNERDRFLWNVHPYINEYIRFADAKAGTVIVFSAGMIGALYAARLHKEFSSTPFCDWKGAAWWSMAAFLLLGLSVVLATIAIRPRLHHAQPKGYIFWGSIIEHRSAEEYASAIESVDNENLVYHLASHVFTLSTIAQQKYSWLNWSIILAVLGGLIGGFVLLLASS